MGTIGRPPAFENPADLQALVDAYFEDHDQVTITGLCLHCGFESRQSFYDYEKKPDFTYTIKRARLMIEHGYEKALMSTMVTGPIFALKNLGWSDKQELAHSSPDGSMTPRDISSAVLEALSRKHADT